MDEDDIDKFLCDKIKENEYCSKVRLRFLVRLRFTLHSDFRSS